MVFKPEDKRKVLEFIGYCLYRGYPIQKVLILLGEGGTGKSTFLNFLRSFVGEDHAEVISPQELASDRFSGIDLKNKLVNAPADITDDPLAHTAFIKSLTGDKVRGQKKFKDANAFINFAKQIFGMNKLPPVKDDTTGWYRRIEIVSMEHVLGETEFTTEFLASLTSKSELLGLFNLAVDALPGLMEWKAFTNQTSIEDTKKRYKAASRPEETFCDLFLSNVPGSMVAKDDIYDRYTIFCKKSGGVALSKNGFTGYIHKNVEWYPKVKDSNKERGVINGKTKPVWNDTAFNDQAWVEWCTAHDVIDV